MTAKLIGHDDLGYQVWQDPATGLVVGACRDQEAAEWTFARMNEPFTLAEYTTEFGFTPLKGS